MPPPQEVDGFVVVLDSGRIEDAAMSLDRRSCDRQFPGLRGDCQERVPEAADITRRAKGWA